MKEIGISILHLDRVDSTNNFIANLLEEGKVKHGTVILADEQTNGRGQRGASWQSEGGMNLTFSFFVQYDNMAVRDQPMIVHHVALTLMSLLKKFGIESQVKWPNDILVNDRKIAGILIENQVKQSMIASSIVGVGLNVNQLDFGTLQATSIRNEVGQLLSVKDVLYGVITAYNELATVGKEQLEKMYLEQLWRLNEKVHFTHLGEEREGVIVGTTPEGLLRIQTNGREEVFNLKEISFTLGNRP